MIDQTLKSNSDIKNKVRYLDNIFTPMNNL